MENMMKRQMTIVAALLFCMTLAVSVQAKSGKSGAKANRTVIGCLQTGSGPNSYVLNNMSGASMNSSKNMSNSGQTPSEMARSEGSYTLVPENNIDLQKWVGKRVRVTGRMGTSTSSSPSDTSSSESNASMNGSEFMVSSIHAASGTCQ